MEAVVLRLCAEVVIDRNCQRVFPPLKKNPTQKEIRLKVSKRQMSSKPGFYSASIEVGEIRDVDEKALFTFDLSTLTSIDRKWITSGTLVFIFKKASNTAQVSRVSWATTSNDLVATDQTNLVLKGGDPGNLQTLQTLINQIKTGNYKPAPSNDQKSMDIEKIGKVGNPSSDDNLKQRRSLLLPNDKEAKLEEIKRLSGGESFLKIDPKLHKDLQKKPLPQIESNITDHNPQKLLKILNKDQLKATNIASGCPKRFESLLNRMFFPKVLQFLTKEDVKNLFMTNKKTYGFLCGLNRKLDFRKFDDVPDKFFVSLLKKNPNIETLITGKMLNIKIGNLPFEEIKLMSLKSFDCSMLSNLDTAITFITKVAPNLRELILPFFKLTSHSLDSLVTTYRSLESFKAIHSGRGLGLTGQINMKLSSVSISSVLSDQKCLKEFEIYSSDPEIVSCLKKLEQSSSQIEKISTFKLHHVLLQSKEHLASLAPLSRLKNLKTLHIGDLHLYDPSTPTGNIVKPPCPPTEQSAAMLGSIIPAFSKLSSLSVGDFFEDSHVDYLAPLAPKLTSLAIRSPFLTDEGLTAILKILPNLKYIKVIDCDQVQGFAFEDFVNQNIMRISVSFNEYGYSQLQKLVKQKYAPGCQVVNYVKDN